MERIPCIRKGCSSTILPATLAKTGGYCMPCHQELKRLEQQQFIAKHRKDVNLYEGLTDVVEILKIMHAPIKYDPMIQYIPCKWNKEQLYRSLSAEDTDRLLAYAADLLDRGDDDTSQDILVSLVCYKNISLTAQHSELISRQVYYPGILFKDANEEVRDQLLKQVEYDEDNRNHLLVALVWIGDDQVVKQLREWRETLPQWIEELHISPDQYTYEAGWEITEEGRRRNLFYESSYAIEKVENDEDSVVSSSESIKLLTSSTHSCMWCGGKLTTLLDIETDHPSLKLMPLIGERLKLETCVICGCYGTIYMELDQEGNSKWSHYNKRPDYLPDTNFDDCNDQLSIRESFQIAVQPRSAYHAAHWMLEPTVSQIGGHPTWIQDAEYPTCPCCSKHMTFISQIDWGEVEAYSEGIFYMFICHDSQITAAIFQQS